MDDLHYYLHQHYGACSLEKCLCRQQRRPYGFPCANWTPTDARNWDEMATKMKALYAAGDKR